MSLYFSGTLFLLKKNNHLFQYLTEVCNAYRDPIRNYTVSYLSSG